MQRQAGKGGADMAGSPETHGAESTDTFFPFSYIHVSISRLISRSEWPFITGILLLLNKGLVDSSPKYPLINNAPHHSKNIPQKFHIPQMFYYELFLHHKHFHVYLLTSFDRGGNRSRVLELEWGQQESAAGIQ